MTTEEEIRIEVAHYQRLRTRGEAFAAAYQAWEATAFPSQRGQAEYTFVGIAGEQIMLETYAHGDTDYEDFPLAYLWLPDWQEREAARRAPEIQRWREAAQRDAAEAQARIEQRDRAEWRRLQQKYGNGPEGPR